MHSSAFGAAARMIFRSLSSAARLSSLKPARYSSMVLALVLGLGAMAEPVNQVSPSSARSMASTASRSIDGTPSDILEQGAFCPILHQSAQCSELCLPRHALDVEGAFYVLEELQKSSRGDSRRCGRFGRVRGVAISWSAWTL